MVRDWIKKKIRREKGNRKYLRIALHPPGLDCVQDQGIVRDVIGTFITSDMTFYFREIYYGVH